MAERPRVRGAFRYPETDRGVPQESGGTGLPKLVADVARILLVGLGDGRGRAHRSHSEVSVPYSLLTVRPIQTASGPAARSCGMLATECSLPLSPSSSSGSSPSSPRSDTSS